MRAKTKSARQREAADKIADIMVACLSRLPEDEQERRVKAIEAISVAPSSRGNTSKRASTPRILPERSPAGAARRKRAHRSS